MMSWGVAGVRPAFVACCRPWVLTRQPVAGATPALQRGIPNSRTAPLKSVHAHGGIPMAGRQGVRSLESLTFQDSSTRGSWSETSMRESGTALLIR